MTDFDDALQRLQALIQTGDVRGALAVLNARTGHRFTALYRFDDDVLRNVWFFDREQPEREAVEAMPVRASYCVFVRDRRATFRVDDADTDDRVADHPKRDQIRAYCGVPLLDDAGRMFGTVCHFDYRPLRISDENIALMEALAPLLQRYSANAGECEVDDAALALGEAACTSGPSANRPPLSAP
ncbi:GAF domain-containing protein [Cognatilysobacter bugurensis]|uniref:GAF domain-containing protein n=1 Tax=Cognatilysobacter bugurensis TaxID=543356 RepID=A0A918T1E7_9GAMM|nr:GAF domain-containing protein [Lysobacter bugurensis]GHA81767.1 hypothetical protein GCM10007067_19560 [Lysobacter bugurensis]